MQPHIVWDDLRYLLAVAEQGSLAGAARLLGVNHWDSPQTDITRFSISIGGERLLTIAAALERPGNVVDMRIYCARLLGDFAERGGQVVIGALQAADVERQRRVRCHADIREPAAHRDGITRAPALDRRPRHDVAVRTV